MSGLSRHYGVREYNFWSPILGCDAVRISTVDEHGGEYFAIIPRAEGAEWRRKRQEACEALNEAIEAELPPGQIRWKVRE